MLAICALFVSLEVSAQNITVTGVVNDQSGQPVAGATIMVKDSYEGTTTGYDGQFQLNVPQSAIIIVDYLGYMPLELPAKAKMEITLQEDTQVIDDVVVIGYGAVRKKELTGAVASLKADELTKQLSSDLGASLQGMVSGVSVTAESGAPGAGSTILIRGVSSVNGGNTPLYVVDGVPHEDDPRISPSEIESIDILKDAASCAIYGTRGAAGVILITTKGGKEGAMKVSVDANIGFKNITSNNYLMNTTEQTYFNLAYNRAISGDPTNYNDETASLDIARADSYFNNNTNLVDAAFVDNALTQTYTATASGGDKHLTYSIVGAYTNQQGSIVNSGYDRFNTRVNLAYNRDNFRFNVSAGMSNENTQYSPSGILIQSIKYNPTQPMLTGDTYVTAGGDEQTNISTILQNFYSEDEAIVTTTFAKYNMYYDITDKLTASGLISLQRKNGSRNKFRPYNKIVDSDGLEISKAEDSYVSNTYSENTSMTWDFGLRYKNEFGKHHFTAMATMTGEEYNFYGYTAYKEGVIDNDFAILDGTSINDAATSSNYYTNKLIGTIARVQYDWDSRYLFSASVRCDGSSKFAPENRWGVFPSASAAWNISDEPFFEPATDVMNNLKLRLSYGTTGNQNFTAYTYAATVTTGYDYVTGSGTSGNLNLGSAQSAYSNELVKWETSKQFNVGFDMGFFDNRFTISAEYYNTDKEDMLFPITLPGSAGSNTSVTLNVGNMTNAGYELAMQYHTHLGKVKIDLGGTFSTNENKITKITGEGTRFTASTTGLITGAVDQSTCTYLAEGYEAGAFFLYPTNGIVNTEEKLAEYQKLDPTAQMGDLIYVDSNGDGVWDDNDRVYSGSGLPEFEIGFNISAAYNNFDLYVNLYSALGHEIMNGSKATAYGYGRHKDLLGMYTDVNTNSPIPTYRGDVKGHNNYRGDSDLWLEDGSYLRIKNITLGYTIPDSAISKIGIKKIRIFVTAQNLFTLTGYTGYDPEIGGGIGTRGMDIGNYPTLATYLGGVNLSF